MNKLIIKSLPEVNDVVKVKIVKHVQLGVMVKLLDYQDMDGLVICSELIKTRKNPAQLLTMFPIDSEVNVGVINISRNHYSNSPSHFIDLSFRRVN